MGLLHNNIVFSCVKLGKIPKIVSNPMDEIRLDVWLRFDVSSFSLTIVIKSPFNLHLTN
jgi:hypothetical protein